MADDAAASADRAVLLIHGLGGTQYDLGSMHKRLKNAGFVTHSLTLPGHGTKPEDLVNVTAEDWIEAVRLKYREVIGEHEVLHVMGMCMGSLLAIETVKREQHAKGRLIALAPPIYIDGWATPWYRALRTVLYRVPGVAARMKVEEEDPFGIKNERLRAIVKAKFERGENFHYGWVPLACVREVDRLRAVVMQQLDRIACPTLVVHARQDELTSLRSAHYLVERIGAGARAGQARMVVLEDSYHMVCVDNDREIVAKHVLEFFDASPAGSLGMAASDDPRMEAAQMRGLLDAAAADLARGDFAALFGRGIPDFAWYQPGANRCSGIYRGKKGLVRLQAWARDMSPPRFGAFGVPSFNAGMGVLPASLSSGSLNSPGVLAFAMRQGRLLEARWFPDDGALEDAHFGGSPLPDGPSEAEKAFEAAARLSKTLAKAPDNQSLLALYALYKQGSIGDVAGERPRITDVIGRAKYDAWAARKGLSREQAMADYVRLVAALHAAESSGVSAA